MAHENSYLAVQKNNTDKNQLVEKKMTKGQPERAWICDFQNFLSWELSSKGKENLQKKKYRYALIVDDDVARDNEWNLVELLENVKCKLNGIESWRPCYVKYHVLEL